MSELDKNNNLKLLRGGLNESHENSLNDNEVPAENNHLLISKSFHNVKKRVSPLWDIRDYVAVNPFWGFKEKDFLDTVKYFKSLTGSDILPKKEYFKKSFKAGKISEYDLEVARKLFLKSGSALSDYSQEELIQFLETTPHHEETTKAKTLSELYDLENQDSYNELITNEISRWAAAYFDEGQALWKISTKNQSFYSWWRSLAKYDKPFSSQNKQFTNLVKSLPRESDHALQFLSEILLEKESLNEKELTNYFFCLIYSILGWSSFIQKFEFEAQRSGDDTQLAKIGGLIDILVIRMAYDISLVESLSEVDLGNDSLVDDEIQELEKHFIWLNAAENSYRRETQDKIQNALDNDQSFERPDIQMAFCIDVRSEILRRHLEHVSPRIQTIGFAGFFGMPISFKGLGHEHADQNCPILLNSALELDEKATHDENELIAKKKSFASGKYFSKSVQSSANSGFSFVETLGFNYIKKIITAGLGISRPNMDFSSMGLTKLDNKNITQNTGPIDLDKKAELAFNALKNMGLTKNFAKYVYFYGHGSETTNNPYASALECGACAGHNGHENAKLLASLLNDKDVQKLLGQKGIQIPKDTVFFSGWHNTAKDELLLDSSEDLSSEQKEELSKYETLFEKACEQCRKERAQKLPWCHDLATDQLKSEFDKKASDWSEIRPEWGLSRNASFIVGRRELTRKINLDGRSFLHDYDHVADSDLSILELIMTAPMVVTNWINMQYYASTVDPIKFGAGNKVLNNVVGGIGCIQGNGGDLLGGLTEQSVWYRGEYFHEPLRLQVFIEAETSSIEKIINKHQVVQDLLTNNWLKVVSIDPLKKDLRLYHAGQWIQVKEDLWN